MIYGYKRPLYDDEQCENQLRSREVDRMFVESHSSPKKRTALEELLMTMAKGDRIVVESFFVLADTMHHLMDIIRVAERDDVTIEFVRERMTTKDPVNETLPVILSHFLKFQTDAVKQSTRLGLDEARRQGKQVGRPKKPDDNVRKAIAMYQSNEYTLMEIKNETGISKSTLYRYLESYGK